MRHNLPHARVFSVNTLFLLLKKHGRFFSRFLARTDAEDPQVPVSEAALLTAAEVFACGLTEDAARTAALAVALRLRPKERIAAYGRRLAQK